nr:DUF6049 family protein [Aeromicrobium senzhongii]
MSRRARFRDRAHYDDVVSIRAWLTAVVVAVSLLVGAPTSTATADDAGSLSVRIDGLSPSRLSADATIQMSGIVRNTGSTPWTSVQAYLVIPRSPFESREQIETAIEDGRSYTGERVVEAGTFAEVGDLAPGAWKRFEIKVPVSRLGLAGPGGVYPVGVQILATDAAGQRSNDAVSRATTFLPWVPDPAQPVPAGLVWPFTPTWRPAETDLEQIAISAESGQLRHYLDAARATPREGRTIVLDPSLLDELNRVTRPQNLPEGVDIPESRGAAVKAWISDLRELALDSTTWIVGYARPDELALSRYPENAETLWKRVDEATSQSLVDYALTGSRASWPTISGTTLEMLEDIRSRGDGPVLVSRESVPDWEPRLGSVVKLETLNGPLPLLVNGTLPDIPGAETPVTLRQRVLAHAALGTLSRESDAASRADALTIVDPSWNPGAGGGAVIGQAVTQRGSGGLTRPVTATDLLRTAPTSYSGRVPEEVDTTSLSASVLDRLATLSDIADRYDEVTVPAQRSDQARDIASLMSVRWRSEPALLDRAVRGETSKLTSALDAITIDSPSTITLSSSRGGFPLTISNGTKQPVLVGLDLSADNPALDLDDVEPVEIDAGERHTFTVEVDLEDQTSSTVTARLSTDSGATFGTPADFNIRSSNVGLIVWAAMAAAGLLVVATWARRFLGRRRRRSEAADTPATPEDDDE